MRQKHHSPVETGLHLPLPPLSWATYTTIYTTDNDIENVRPLGAMGAGISSVGVTTVYLTAKHLRQTRRATKTTAHVIVVFYRSKRNAPPLHRLAVLLELAHVRKAGQEEQEEREQAGHAQGKVFTPGDFGPPRIAENPKQVRAHIFPRDDDRHSAASE